MGERPPERIAHLGEGPCARGVSASFSRSGDRIAGLSLHVYDDFPRCAYPAGITCSTLPHLSLCLSSVVYLQWESRLHTEGGHSYPCAFSFFPLVSSLSCGPSLRVPFPGSILQEARTCLPLHLRTSSRSYCKTSRLRNSTVETPARMNAQSNTTIKAWGELTGTHPLATGLQAITPSRRSRPFARKAGSASA